MLADLQLDGDLRRDAISVFLGRRGFVMLLPTGDGRFQCVAVDPSAHPGDHGGPGMAELQQFISGYLPAAARLREVRSSSRFLAARCLSPPMRHGRELVSPSRLNLLLTDDAGPAAAPFWLEQQLQPWRELMIARLVAPVPDDEEQSRFFRAFGGGQGLVLVRPDSYVCFAGRQNALPRLVTWLNTWFPPRPRLPSGSGARHRHSAAAPRTR